MSLEKVIQSAKKMVLLPLMAAALYATPAKGNLITQYAPNYDISPGQVELAVELENNDSGAVYDSYDLSLFNSLSLSLWNLPQNQTTYTSIDDMTSDWSLSIRPNPVGEVNAGWSATPGDYSSVAITHANGGIDDDYEGWHATQQNPNQDMMALTLSIPITQLDGNTIAMNTSPTPNMGIGHWGINELSAQGYEYNIVPEPSTIALLGLGEDNVASISISGLVLSSTNSILQAPEVYGPWTTSHVFVATSATHSVAIAFTNESGFFSAVIAKP